MACSSVLARVRQAVVDVELAVLSLETFGALTLVSSDEIFAESSVLTRGGFAFVYVLLAVGAGVAVLTVTTMRVADVFAGAVVAELL